MHGGRPAERNTRPLKDERSGVKGACRPSDAAWLLEQAKAQGITDTEPLCVAEIQGEAFNQRTGVTPTKHQNNATSGILTGWHEGMWV